MLDPTVCSFCTALTALREPYDDIDADIVDQARDERAW
jgi:hypothetical protein